MDDKACPIIAIWFRHLWVIGQKGDKLPPPPSRKWALLFQVDEIRTISFAISISSGEWYSISNYWDRKGFRDTYIRFTCTLYRWRLNSHHCCVSPGPPRVAEKVSHRQSARLGSAIKLPCPVEGDPPPLKMWTKDGRNIHSGWIRFRILRLGLKIKEVEAEDAGTYICKATNGFGSVNINYTLIVIGMCACASILSLILKHFQPGILKFFQQLKIANSWHLVSLQLCSFLTVPGQFGVWNVKLFLLTSGKTY